MSQKLSLVTCREIWQEVSDDKSIDGGLYEESDLLLGDHLTEKSDTVQSIDVSMPHMRSRKLKDHKC